MVGDNDLVYPSSTLPSLTAPASNTRLRTRSLPKSPTQHLVNPPPASSLPHPDQLVEILLRQLLRRSHVIRPHSCPDRESSVQERRRARTDRECWDLALLEIQAGEVGVAVGFGDVVLSCGVDVVAMKGYEHGFPYSFMGT